MQVDINYLWAKTTLLEIAKRGVKKICLAAGSRSSPLVITSIITKQFKIYTHYDERALAFMALGMAKATNEPVIIIVTSGTAVANLLPAVIEANNTGKKLIVISADRPSELINCGANQAIIQTNIFSRHAYSLNLPSPSQKIKISWLINIIQKKLIYLEYRPKPLHINLPFPEPLYFEEKKIVIKNQIKKAIKRDQNNRHKITNKNNQINLWSNLYNKKIIFVVGNVELATARKIVKFSEYIGCPILCDIQAGINSNNFAHYDLWLDNVKIAKCLKNADLIIQFGGQIVSSRLLKFIAEVVTNKDQYWLVDNLQRKINPNNLPQKRFYISFDHWFKKVRYQDKKFLYKYWAQKIINRNQSIKKIINKSFSNKISECSLAYNLPSIVGSNDLFIGNSLPIRLLDMLCVCKGNNVFTNRGASGIDGIIASAIGVQKARKKPIITIVGDHSLLYDINSIAISRKTRIPNIIIVINNNGGGIFNFFPIPKKIKNDYFRLPHHLNFADLASIFGITYHNPKKISELKEVVMKFIQSGQGTLLVELNCKPNQASIDINKLRKQISSLN